MLRDIRYALRSLFRDRGFATTVALTLAVCVAANTAIFAIVHSVLLQPLPVPEANSILLLSNEYPKAGVGVSHNSAAGDYYDHLAGVPALADQAMFQEGHRTIDVNGTPEQLTSMAVTPSIFPLLRVNPAHGRPFNAGEGEIGNEQKVIISDAFWHQMFAGDVSAIGKQLRVGGRPFTVVGIMPPGFVFMDPDTRVWVPLAFTAEMKKQHHNNNWQHIGRLKPGTSIEQVKTQVAAVNRANDEKYPEMREILHSAGYFTKVEPLQRMLVEDIESSLYFLWAGAALLLIIGALNIANLAFARLASRRKEMATRLALGASRAQLARQLLTENILVTTAGGVAGILLGAGALKLMATSWLSRLPRASEVQIDLPVILVSLAMAVAIGVLIGLLPLAGVWRTQLASVLREGGRGSSAGKNTGRLRQVLVGAEIGLAFVLLMGAGLLLASFQKLLTVDPGFRSNGVLTVSTSLPRARYKEDASTRAFLNRSLEVVRRLPGVTAAGATTTIPFGSDHSDSVVLAEGYVRKPGESMISPSRIIISPGYFEAMGTALVKGRYFRDSDTDTSQKVIIVDEQLAQRFWPNQDPIGRRMFNPNDAAELEKAGPKTVFLTIVGVVRSVRLQDMAGSGNSAGAYYFPFEQSPQNGFTLAIRTAGDPTTIAKTVRSGIAALDPELALYEIKTMEEWTALSLASRKTSMMLALTFAVVALFLAAIGLYGVLAYLVTQRRREIGIRIALGSTASRVVKLVVAEGLVLTAVGLGAGIVGVAAVSRLMANQVYGVRPLDPLVMAAVGGVIALIAVGACALPAWRAVRVDPISVLGE